MRRGLIALFAVLSAALPVVSRAEKSTNWRVFRVADGLPSHVCSSVTLDSQGNVLVSFLDSVRLTELNGYDLTNFSAPPGGHTRFYISPGGQFWTINRDGLQESRDEEWLTHGPSEFGMESAAMTNGWANESVIYPVRQGLIILLLPDRLVQFSSEPGRARKLEVLKQAKEAEIGTFISMTPARDGGLWISGKSGIAKFQGPLRLATANTGWRDFPAPESWHAQDFHRIHEAPDGDVTVLAGSTTNRDQLLVTSFEGQSWSGVRQVNEPLLHAWRAAGKGFWAITRTKLLWYGNDAPAPVENREISARQFFDVALEPSGAFWLATSDGLFRHASLFWQADARTEGQGSPVKWVSPDPQRGIWFLTETALHWRDDQHQKDYPFPTEMAQLLKTARRIYPLKERTLAIDTAADLVKFDAASGVFRIVDVGDPGERHVRALGFIKNGELVIRSVSEKARVVLVYDGRAVHGLDFPLPESVPGNISALLTLQNGDLWVSTDTGTAWLRDKKWRVFSSADKSAPSEVRAFLETADKKVWCAAANSIWQFDGRNWKEIWSGLGGVKSMIQTRDGSVWVACGKGLLRLFQKTWIENGSDDGLPSTDVLGLCEDKNEHLWAATSGGIAFSQPKADTDPPRTTISPLSQQDIPEGGTLTLSYAAADKWKSTGPERLLFSQHLDGRDWSPFTEADSVTFPELPAGKHYFQVRAMDRNGNVDPLPASLEFVVIVPWYREPRLVVISAAGAAVALFFAALAFNRHRRLLYSYAEVEKKVAQRTFELERANRELLHSQKMTALGTLSAGIAHDFNNILSIVKGSAQIIEENLHDPQKIGTRVERINTVVEQGAGIVKAMLGFSRESNQEAGPCDLNEAVNDTIKLLGDRFLREVEIKFEPTPELPDLQCSKDLVQQILLNFIFNAAEAMPKSKQIVMATGVISTCPDGIVLAPHPARAFACVCVRDNGAGIAPEILPRIFEPFFTTKAMSARRGTGLGLSMVYEFAKKMNAGLAVSSTVGEGSTFTLILPIPEKSEGQKSALAEKSRKQALSRL